MHKTMKAAKATPAQSTAKRSQRDTQGNHPPRHPFLQMRSGDPLQTAPQFIRCECRARFSLACVHWGGWGSLRSPWRGPLPQRIHSSLANGLGMPFFHGFDVCLPARFRVSPRMTARKVIDADSRDAADSLAIGEDRSNWLRLVRNRKQRERYGPAHKRRRRDFARRIERGEVFNGQHRAREATPAAPLGRYDRGLPASERVLMSQLDITPVIVHSSHEAAPLCGSKFTTCRRASAFVRSSRLGCR